MDEPLFESSVNNNSNSPNTNNLEPDSTWIDDIPLSQNTLPDPNFMVVRIDGIVGDATGELVHDGEFPVGDDTLDVTMLAGSDPVELGVCGLDNLGNTCFMSAGIQCLMATPPIVTALLNCDHQPENNLTNALSDLTRRIWTGHESVITPNRFKSALVNYFPQYNDCRQNDCQEFLALLLDALHDQLNVACKNNCTSIPSEPLDNKSICSPKCTQSTSEGFVCALGPSEAVSSGSQKLNCSISEAEEITEEVLNSASVSTSKGKFETDCCAKLNNNLFGNSQETHILGEEVSVAQFDVDLAKTAKTSNANVLVTDGGANNKLRFDSDKYPRVDSSRRLKEVVNVNSFQLCENNGFGKRCKTTTTRFSSPAELKEGLDLKRVKLNCPTDEVDEKNMKMEHERLQKNSDQFVDKNQRMESERKESNDVSERPVRGESLRISREVIDFIATCEPEADLHWQSHLSSNRSVIVDTFQGQFKSTVVCSTCNFVSVTYEPFMYLSVPLPNALQRSIQIRYIDGSQGEPLILPVNVNSYDTVGSLKEKFVPHLSLPSASRLLMAEVLDHHVSKIVGDNIQILHLNTNRLLYAFHLIPISEDFEEPEEQNEDNSGEQQCLICFEDKHSDMKQHDECNSIICDSCIKDCCAHSEKGNLFACPKCFKEVQADVNFHPLNTDSQLSLRMFNIPMVFRVDTVGDGNNNQKGVKLFGHPRLLRLPNACSAQDLHALVNRCVPYSEPFKLRLVDGQGLNCSRCMFGIHCRGDEVPTEGEIVLKSYDNLAVTYSSLPAQAAVESEPALVEKSRTLSLYDCISAFSTSECLDGPWYCPQCELPRCATKTLSVWRYPEFLIVYLKRFVFHNRISTKLDERVTFPLEGLSLNSRNSEVEQYNLYACVCHDGVVSWGHYTAYTKHPHSGQWHYFSDNLVSSRAPQEEDYSNAYILFYHKQVRKSVKRRAESEVNEQQSKSIRKEARSSSSELNVQNAGTIVEDT